MRSKGERDRLTLRLPIHMHAELAGIAAERNMSVNELIVEIIKPITACQQAREEARAHLYIEPDVETWLAWARAVSNQE